MTEPEDFLRQAPLSAPSAEHEQSMQALFSEARSHAHRRAMPVLPTLLFAVFGAVAACLTVAVSPLNSARRDVQYEIRVTPAVRHLLTEEPFEAASRPVFKFSAIHLSSTTP